MVSSVNLYLSSLSGIALNTNSNVNSVDAKKQDFNIVLFSIFEKMDVNQDKNISQDEFANFLETHKPEDKNKDGSIPPVGIMPPPMSPEMMITNFDVDKDNKLSVEELKAAMPSKQTEYQDVLNKIILSMLKIGSSDETQDTLTTNIF